MLVVQVIQGKKEKLKFSAPPPSPAGPSEYKVKPSKKTAAAAPAISKRITTTAANASVALPAMDMNASTGPDVMASVMSGLGASGLGAGAGGAAGGMASMPLAGLTAFGFKGKGTQSLVGYFYDLKQTPDRQTTDVPIGGNPLAGSDPVGNDAEAVVMGRFFNSDWDESLLKKYYKVKDPMNALQIWVPGMASTEGPKAFGVQKEVRVGSHWIVLYKGTVVAPKDGTFRFIGFGDDLLAVRFDNNLVFGTCFFHEYDEQLYGKSFLSRIDRKDDVGFPKGVWFSVERGKSYPIEILIGEMPGGGCGYQLMIEDRNPEKPYPHRTLPGKEKYLAYPVFQVRKGAPLPQYVKPEDARFEKAPETAPDPIVFPAK